MKRLAILSVLVIATVASSGCCMNRCGGLFGGNRLFGAGMFGNSSCCEAPCSSCGDTGCSTCGAGDAVSGEIILPAPTP